MRVLVCPEDSHFQSFHSSELLDDDEELAGCNKRSSRGPCCGCPDVLQDGVDIRERCKLQCIKFANEKEAVTICAKAPMRLDCACLTCTLSNVYTLCTPQACTLYLS